MILVGNVKLEEIILDEVNKTNVKPNVVNQGLNVLIRLKLANIYLTALVSLGTSEYMSVITEVVFHIVDQTLQ